MMSFLRQPIVFDGTKTPVKTALFLLICAAWLLPGLAGRDPWKPEEAVAFGVIHSMLAEGAWLTPMIGGLPYPDYPPFFYWLSALAAKLLSPLLPLHDGARVASAAAVGVTLWFLHKAASRLFDERAGRIAVLLLLGCLGFFWRSHHINPELFALAGLAIALHGMTRIRSEPRKGGVTTGLGGALMALSIGAAAGAAVLLSLVLLMGVLRDWRNRTFLRGILAAAVITAAGALAVPLWLLCAGVDTQPYLPALLGISPDVLRGRPAGDTAYFLRILPWYALPALPLAAWLWARERTRLAERVELALPLAVFITMLVFVSFARRASDATGLVLLLPLALAAAQSLDRLPRGLASFMDWFSLMFFGVLAFAFWFYWTAAVTGVPAKAARQVMRQVPGFEFVFSPLAFLLAAAITLLWIYAVARAHRNNRRAIINWTAGLAHLWVLGAMLGFPALDHAQSYRQPARDLAAKVAGHPPACVAASHLGDAQRATLHHLAQLKFAPAEDFAAGKCPWLLVQGTRLLPPATPAGAALAWEGARPGDNVERFRLYRRG